MTTTTSRNTFGGTFLTPESDGYDAARSLWNGDIDRRPAGIALCRDSADVAHAVALGREEGLEIAVRGGGHHFAGHSSCDGGLMINLSSMNNVTVDPQTRRARCGGGSTWGDYDQATQAHGLASPGGFISHTGVAGLTLGGGIGWLNHRLGLSCDNLVSAQVVTATGDLVTASADEHADLFWALRGGGGNFGVVTEFEFAVHPVGPDIHLGMFFWPADQGGDVLRFTRELFAGLPSGAGRSVMAVTALPASFVPKEHEYRSGYLVAVVSWESAAQLHDMVAPIRKGPAPLFEWITPITYTALQRLFDDTAPWGIRAYEKALYLEELPDEAIDVIASLFPQKRCDMSMLPIFPLGDAYAEVGETANAWGGRRNYKWLVNMTAVTTNAEDFQHDRAWVRELYEALSGFATSSGTYLNFLADADESRVRASYGSKYDRLAAIKAQYDPDNVFHLNANIRPAAS